MSIKRSRQRTPGYDREFKQYHEYLQQMPAYRHLRPDRLKFFAHVLSRLRKVSLGDPEWTACCPAHADSRPSLSTRLSDKGDVLLRCFAGCSFEVICRELNLEQYEMFNSSCVWEPIRRVGSRGAVPSTMAAADPEWMHIHSGLRNAICERQLDELAGLLQVSADSLNALEVGWSATEMAWTFPERNGRNEVVGILRRYPDGRKLAMAGSRRGLSLPDGWRDNQSAIYVCEGQSDTAAALSCGYRAIGRPGKAAGMNDLINVLAGINEEIIVVFDNDLSTGRDEESSFSNRLADGIRRSVGEFRPPRQFKDLRDYLTKGKQQ